MWKIELSNRGRKKKCIKAACFAVGWSEKDYEREKRYIEKKAILNDVHFSGMNYKHYLVKHFGWEILNRKAKEAELLSLIEDVYETYKNYEIEKMQKEMK